jgi:hypothetical protein
LILNFLPLLLWMLLYPVVVSWVSGREKVVDPKPRAKTYALFYIAGVVIWFLTGLGCGIASRL